MFLPLLIEIRPSTYLLRLVVGYAGGSSVLVLSGRDAVARRAVCMTELLTDSAFLTEKLSEIF